MKTTKQIYAEEMHSCFRWLQQHGFEFSNKVDRRTGRYYCELEILQPFYGSYHVEVYYSNNIHRIKESFRGATSRIEGWEQDTFNGSITTKEDFMTVVRLTGLDQRLKEWNEDAS